MHHSFKQQIAMNTVAKSNFKQTFYSQASERIVVSAKQNEEGVKLFDIRPRVRSGGLSRAPKTFICLREIDVLKFEEALRSEVNVAFQTFVLPSTRTLTIQRIDTENFKLEISRWDNDSSSIILTGAERSMILAMFPAIRMKMGLNCD